MKKRWIYGIAALMTAVLLAGCDTKDDRDMPENSGIYVRKDGSVISADMEAFAEPYYDKEELRHFIEQELAAYPGNQGGEAVVRIQDLEAEGTQMRLRLAYATCEDYLAFNEAGNVLLETLSQRKQEDRYYLEVTVSAQQKDPIWITVQGTIQSVSNYAEIVGESTAVVSAGGSVVIIYK